MTNLGMISSRLCGSFMFQTPGLCGVISTGQCLDGTEVLIGTETITFCGSRSPESLHQHHESS